MVYFDDLIFVMADHLSRCRAVIDQSFQDFFNLQLCWRGPMIFSVNRGPKTVFQEPTVFWHHPRHSYQYAPAKPGGFWHHYWVTFRGPRGRRIMEDGFLSLDPRGYRTLLEPEAFREVFAELVERVRQHPGQPQPEAALLLEQLLLRAGKAPQSRPTGENEILRLAEEMRKTPREPRDFAGEARRLGISYGHFRRCFRELVGRAPLEHLLFCRMQQAALALAQGGGRVYEVARRAGYEDPVRFSKLFKRQMGLPPRRFRDHRISS